MDGDENGYIWFYTLENTVIKYDVLPFIGDDDDDDSPVDGMGYPIDKPVDGWITTMSNSCVAAKRRASMCWINIDQLPNIMMHQNGWLLPISKWSTIRNHQHWFIINQLPNMIYSGISPLKWRKTSIWNINMIYHMLYHQCQHEQRYHQCQHDVSLCYPKVDACQIVFRCAAAPEAENGKSGGRSPGTAWDKRIVRLTEQIWTI